jgi:hypothetical protein
MSAIEISLSVALGLALAAATGFRVFLPLLIASIAAHTGHLALGENFAWLGTLPATVMLGVAAAVEISAYYIPVVDNALDSIAMPAALIAGAVVSAAVMVDLPPLVKWSAAIVGGAGAAGTVQMLTTIVRAKSTAFTGGLGNPALATAESGGAVFISLLALLAPLVAIGVLAIGAWLIYRLIRRLTTRPAPPASSATGP